MALLKRARMDTSMTITDTLLPRKRLKPFSKLLINSYESSVTAPDFARSLDDSYYWIVNTASFHQEWVDMLTSKLTRPYKIIPQPDTVVLFKNPVVKSAFNLTHAKELTDCLGFKDKNHVFINLDISIQWESDGSIGFAAQDILGEPQNDKSLLLTVTVALMDNQSKSHQSKSLALKLAGFESKLSASELRACVKEMIVSNSELNKTVSHYVDFLMKDFTA